MIEDMMIWKLVAEHQTMHLQESNSDPSILENDGGHVRANRIQSRIAMQAQLQCGSGLDEQFETVSAQIARRLFRSPEISLPQASSRVHVQIVWCVIFATDKLLKVKAQLNINPHCDPQDRLKVVCAFVRARGTVVRPPARFSPVEAVGRGQPNTRCRPSSGRHPNPFTEPDLPSESGL